MTVVGTAGHVDHGKSTLLQKLTGRDPDRWDEEKRRGLTIDLGFTWTELPSGREVSFVDVPGHERFIKNMLAGVEAVDIALFVVAADEGWKPQTEEHLAVLDLLEVDRAVIALTKTDRVDSDMVDLVAAEIFERVAGTTLEGSTIVPVSAVDGTGLDRLRTEIDSLIQPPPVTSDARLWVDRRFTVSGAGTVVTGTLLGGPLTVGDELNVEPVGGTVRIRGIQSHERQLETVDPRRRVALNVVGSDHGIERGVMVGKGTWSPTSRFAATFRWARYVETPPERGDFHLHTGTTAVAARLRSLGDGVVVTTAGPLPLRYGDRFIVRETGRRMVVGGGTVLDPSPGRHRTGLRASTSIPTGLTPEAAADHLLAIRGTEVGRRLTAHTGSGPRTGIEMGELVVSSEEYERIADLVVEEIGRHHEQVPLREGMPIATLASRLGIPIDLTMRVVAEESGVGSDGRVAWLLDRPRGLDADQAAGWESARTILEGAGLQPPPVSELPIDLEVVHFLVRSGELVRVSDSLVYLADDAEELRRRVASMHDGFSIAELRDVLGVSRKQAVPIAEWADSQGLTRRRGDLRSPSR